MAELETLFASLTPDSRARAQMELAQRIGRIGSWEVDLVNRTIEWSREMMRLLGMTESRPFSASALLEAVHPDDRSGVLDGFVQACKSGDPIDLRCRLTRSAEIRHLEVCGECRRDGNGDVIAIAGYARDITEEVRVAEQLALSEARYRSVVDSQSELVCRFKADGTVLVANLQYCRCFGLDVAAVQGIKWQPMAVPEDVPAVEARLRQLSPQNPVVVIENRVHTATQGVRWMEFINHGFFDHEGRLVELQAVGRDIHDRKLLQQQLAQALQLRQAMLNNELVGIMTVRNRRIEWANLAFEQMLGYTPGELHGASTRQVYPSQAAFDSMEALAYPVLAQGQRLSAQVEFLRKDDAPVWVDISGAPLGDDGLSLWVAVDATARKHGEDERQRRRDELERLVSERTANLAAALELAEAANRAKSAFLAMISHELRTPMNAILGLTPIIKRRVTDAKSLDWLTKIELSGVQLLALINDLLDATRIEARRLHLASVPFRLADITARLDLAWGPKAREKGLLLQVESPGELLTHEFRGDPLRIEQVLGNLVGNAIKFTLQGSVRIRLGALPDEEHERTLLRIEVIDTGEGISVEDQQRLFTLFEQVDKSMARRYMGAGLGLALCRQLTTLMGGHISVTSGLGEGSCFWVEIPLADAAFAATPVDLRSDAHGQLRASYAGTRVLVVEDDEISAEVSRLMLEEVKFDVDWAADGAGAIEKVASRSYDLILMDLQMPQLDGLATTRAIRQMPHGRSMPIVALTARVFDVDLSECQSAGLDDVVPKPVLADAFYERILRALDGSHSGGTVACAGS